jgi:hypothetical protein
MVGRRRFRLADALLPSPETLKLLSVVCVALLLASCASISGYPEPSGDPKAEAQSLKIYFSADEISKYNSETDPKAKERDRNEIVNGRLRSIDLNFYAFEKALFTQHGVTTLAGDITILGLNAAGAVVGGELTKSALAAASGGIAGAKGAIDTDLFYQKTLPALVAQMQAQRKVVLVSIRKGLSESVDQYPLQEALIDVDAYYAAGTIPGALTGIIEDAGSKSAAAEIEIKRDQAWVANQPQAARIVDRIAKLTPEQALALAKLMEPHLSERSSDLQKLVQVWDPKKLRLSSGTAAKALLLRWAAMDQRDSKSLSEWNEALDEAQK